MIAIGFRFACQTSNFIQDRHCEAANAAEAIHGPRARTGLLRRGACYRAALRADPLAPRNDVDSLKTHLRPLAAGFRPRDAKKRCASKENKKRAQGKPGAHGTRGPVRHYAYGEKETPQVQTGHRLPCAMVLTAYFALSPVIGLMLPPSPVIKGLLPFAGSTPLAERQDHTTWPSASHRHRHFDRPMSKPE